MVTIQGGKLFPVPFPDILDPVTGRVRLRYVDVGSEAYQTLSAYMIRLRADDLTDPERRRALAQAANLDEAALARRFRYLVA